MQYYLSVFNAYMFWFTVVIRLRIQVAEETRKLTVKNVGKLYKVSFIKNFIIHQVKGSSLINPQSFSNFEE